MNNIPANPRPRLLLPQKYTLMTSPPQIPGNKTIFITIRKGALLFDNLALIYYLKMKINRDYSVYLIIIAVLSACLFKYFWTCLLKLLCGTN